jgi:hypothetical protein
MVSTAVGRLLVAVGVVALAMPTPPIASSTEQEQQLDPVMAFIDGAYPGGRTSPASQRTAGTRDAD